MSASWSIVWLSLAVIFAGYLLGSFPAAYLIGRLREGIDIREVGSRNMGTMNTIHEVGIVEGIIVLIVDVGKGIGTVIAAHTLNLPRFVALIAGGAAIIGHMFPVFLKFRGGKGGATSMGISLFLMPLSTPVYVAITLLAYWLTRNMTASYGFAFVVFPLFAWFGYHSFEILAFSLAVILALWVQSPDTVSEIKRGIIIRVISRFGSAFRS